MLPSIIAVYIVILGPSEQYKIINEFIEEYKVRGEVVGDKWYLIDNKWYVNWKNYVKV